MSEYFVPLAAGGSLKEHAWDGYTLLLPCVSIGNVPQLTVDLFVKTFKVADLKLLGYIKSNHVHPFAGPNPFDADDGTFAASIEVYESPSRKLVFIQQRSHIYKEYRNEFYRDLFHFLGRHSFELIMVITSSFDHFLDPGLDTKPNPIKYLSANISDGSLIAYLEETLDVSKVSSPGAKLNLPGGGPAIAYLEHAKQQAGGSTKVLLLCMYCSEGDNRQHAFKLADCIADILQQGGGGSSNALQLTPSRNCRMSKYSWSVPSSWHTLFGNDPPSEIY